MLRDFFKMYPESRKTFYDEKYKDYNFTDGVPQQLLFVKLKPDVSAEDRQFVANGIRSTFKSQATLFMDTKQLIDNLKSIMRVFNFFILLIGLISLTLTFFLLLVSTRQNVKDNIWEYGVLRSMGFTKAQGQRLYMYEAFLVVCSAALLGVCIGLVTATLVTA